MINIDLKIIITFTLLNLVYVTGGCLKDIARQKLSKKWSAIIATLTYMYYVIVLKTLVDIPTEWAIIGTGISNFLGDIIGRIISEHLIPRGVVCYRFTINKDRADIDEINNYLETHNFGYKWEGAHSLHNEYLCYQVYTQNKEEDRSIEALMTLHNIDKYNKSESKNTINLSKKV
jgi:uncharacterized protein YebE (UPF0316 family)